ncbi:MAG TPA: hypothetical protein VF941_05065 [Clostridia bacterium]
MSENNYKYANDNIKLVLKFKGWTHKKLCEKSGMEMHTLQRRLKDIRGWSMTEGICIAKALGVPVCELFFTRMVPNGVNPENKVS